MKKEFLLNLVLLVGINLLIKPFYAFGIDLQVQNRVGMEDYGLYFALFNFSYIFQIISDLGIQQHNSRFIAQNPKLLAKYLPDFLALKGVLALIFFTVSLITGLILGYGKAESIELLLLMLCNQILITFIFYLRSNLAALQFYRTDSLISALDKLLLIGFVAFLLWGPWKEGFTIQWFVYAQTASFLVTAISVWIILFRKVKIPLRLKWNSARIVAILRKSWPYALVVFLMTAYTRLDAVMLERMLPGTEGEIQSGVYAFGYRLLDAFNMIGYLFASLLLPMFARMLQKKEEIGDLLKTAHQWMFFLTASLSYSVLFFGDELSHWMLKDASEYTVSVFSLLIWSSISSGMIYIFGTLLTANGSMKQMNLVFTIGLILNIIGNAFLIPNFGAWGAALSTVVTQSFVAIAEIILVYRQVPNARSFYIPTEILRTLMLCMGLFLIFGLMNSYLAPFIDWRISIILGGFAGLAWAERIGAVELKGFFTILQSRSQ
jgi:O-antigen/teichoic acid export membrane protein